MRSKNWSLALAIMWSVCLLCDIVSAAGGAQPTWTSVFCPLIILVGDRWCDYIDACQKEKYDGD